jgi:hypothetical protein
MIHLQCPHCHSKLAVKEAMAGRLGACPKCKNKIRIPQLETITPDDLPEERISAAPKRESAAQTTRPPRRFEEDDDADEPLAPPKRRRFEDVDDRADDAEPAPRRRKKRRKKRRRESSSSVPSFLSDNPVLFALAGVAGILLITCGLALLFPPVALLPIGLGWLLLMVSNIWFLVCAFQDDVMSGVLCLLIPFYSLYYLITHFDEVRMPIFTGLLGFVLVMGGSCAMGIGGAMHNEPPPNFLGALQISARVID